MRRKRQLFTLLAVAACGDSSVGGNRPGSGTDPDAMGSGLDGGNPQDGATSGDASSDAKPPPPPAPVCTPPTSAVDTSQPTTVVGAGTGTCSEGALAVALAKGGTITFNCGGPTSIPITQTLTVRTDTNTVIDGGGTVTLDGGGKVGILSFNHGNYRVNDNQLTLQHLTLAHGKVAGSKPYAPAPDPCSHGFYDGYGGALYFRDGVLLVVDVTFRGNAAEALGPDVGGGAIAIHGAKKATVISSVFSGNTGANGGAIEVLNSELDVYNTTFDGNSALGNGANSDDANKCSAVADNGQHQVGSGGNGGAVGIDGGDDGTHVFCGVVFRGNKAGVNALGGAIGRTPDRAKQTTVIDRCLFDGNTSQTGGAAYFHNSTLQIRATTFHANNVPRAIELRQELDRGAPGCIGGAERTFEKSTASLCREHDFLGEAGQRCDIAWSSGRPRRACLGLHLRDGAAGRSTTRCQRKHDGARRQMTNHVG